MIILIPFFWFLLIGHRLIFYRIENNICGPPAGFYRYYDNYFQVIFSSLCPAIGMSVLTFLLIKNVRSVVQRRILPMISAQSVNISNGSMINQMDKLITIMLTTESFIAVITYIPYAIELTYENITEKWSKSPLYLAWESLFTELIHLFSYVFFATSFYVSFFSNVCFRRKIKRALRIQRYYHRADHTVM